MSGETPEASDAGTLAERLADYLAPTERQQLQRLRDNDAFVEEVLGQVDRILQSRHFDRVQRRTRDFLGYVVAKTLLGQTDRINQTAIAIAVFDESADFNPVETSKVRVAAIELRRRLTAYYRREGRH